MNDLAAPRPALIRMSSMNYPDLLFVPYQDTLDLLTVDALMTQALEIAARDPKLMEEFPELAMRRIASR